MDGSESHMHVNLGKTDSRSLSRAEPAVLYAEVNFKTLSAPRVREDRDFLHSTSSELNFRKEERGTIDDDEDPPISSEPGVAQEQGSKVKKSNITYILIFILSLVTSALILIVAGLSIYGIQRDLCQNYTELETKYRSANETKAQICEFLTNRREQTCSEGWVTKKGRCYYASTLETDYSEAMQECANRDSRLLQIKGRDEVRFLSHRLLDGTHSYWIGKCETGDVGWRLLYKVSTGTRVCRHCGTRHACNLYRRYICEKSAPVFPDVPVKIQGLCQQPVEGT